MKIGILTHYNVNNQGAQLQMYSMYKKIEQLGHEPVILTYNKNFDFVGDDLKKRNIITITSIPYILKEFLLKKGFGLTYFNANKYLMNKKFSNNNFNFQNYTRNSVDCAIVGSDEVLSIDYGVNIMMYGHCVNTKRVISYAPSFGQTNIDILKKHNCLDLVSSGLNNFYDISARDENTKNVINQLTGKDAKIVCDPALLYDFSNTHTKVKLPKDKYIIIYAYDKNMTAKAEVEAIKKYAKNKNLKTLSVGTYHKWCDININCDCLEWIEYFRNAEAVITDTFHGTIVATITGTPMAVFIRQSLNKNKLSYLLKQLKISDREINEITFENLQDTFLRKFDVEQINKTLIQLRKESNEYLINAIGN